jgi:hypothetical protein
MTATSLTADVTDADLATVLAVAAEVGASAEGIFLSLWLESGWRTTAGAGRGEGGAHGIQQIMGFELADPIYQWDGPGYATVDSQGKRHLTREGLSAFDQASLAVQMEVARRFWLKVKRGHQADLRDPTAFYLLNLLPDLVDHAGDPGFVLMARDEALPGRPTSFYRGNAAVFDPPYPPGSKGYIDVADLTRVLSRIAASTASTKPQDARLRELWARFRAVAGLPEGPPSVASRNAPQTSQLAAGIGSAIQANGLSGASKLILLGGVLGGGYAGYRWWQDRKKDI